MALEQKRELQATDSSTSTSTSTTSNSTNSSTSQFGQDNHQAFIEGIEVCAERFPNDEDGRVNCFAEVVSTTIGRRASKRTGTAIPADSAESRRRGSAHAHAALRAKRAAMKAEKEKEAAQAAEKEKEAAKSAKK